jgi:FkbM family methyltransferase
MNRHTVEKRIRGLRCGMLVGRSRNLRLPGSILVGRQRQSLYLPDEDGVRNMFLEILLSDVYGLERRGRNAFTAVLDVGANVGLFAVAARRLHRHAVIHAYEPNLDVGPYLSVQLRVARATWFREAVGGKAARGRLEVYPGESGLTQCVPDESGPVPIVSLATAVERLGRVDLAKIDCEGSEWAMFDGAEPWKSIHELALEYHLSDGHTVDEAVDRVRALGFGVTGLSRDEGGWRDYRVEGGLSLDGADRP